MCFADLSAVQEQLCEQISYGNASDRCTLSQSSEDLGCSEVNIEGHRGVRKFSIRIMDHLVQEWPKYDSS
jgi:hypothetical protein